MDGMSLLGYHFQDERRISNTITEVILWSEGRRPSGRRTLLT
mgnify:CR=1 FL=1